MRKFLILASAASLMAVSGCDVSKSTMRRAIVGGAIGCAAGQVLADGRCVEGAAVGAGAGVLTK